MATETVRQPSAAPSRKVLMGAVGGVVTAFLQYWAVELSGGVDWLSWLGDPLVRQAVPLLGAGAAAYIFEEYKN